MKRQDWVNLLVSVSVILLGLSGFRHFDRTKRLEARLDAVAPEHS